MRKQTGFTLIELMVVVAIVGILSAIALPEFEAYSDRVHRADDCKQPLLSIAILMEDFRGANQTYPGAGLLSATTLPHAGSKGEYVYRILASTASTYTLECTASTGADPDCGSLTYDNFGRKDAPNATNGRTPEMCWR